MNKKIGFIGCGKMAKAIIKGISDFLPNNNIIASTKTEESAKKVKAELNIKVVNDNKEVAEFADIIFIATKPNQAEDAIKAILPVLDNKKIIVSVAAGISTKKIENIVGNMPVIRVMPNTPALVKEGMSATARGEFATLEQENSVQEILEKIGKVISVDENQIDVVTAISGSGPAFFYQIFEDMAQAGVKLGLDYEKSLLLAVQTAIGSAKMTLNREKPLTDLIDSVATKGGCTEVGIKTMKELKSSDLFDDVITKTTQKAHELG